MLYCTKQKIPHFSVHMYKNHIWCQTDGVFIQKLDSLQWGTYKSWTWYQRTAANILTATDTSQGNIFSESWAPWLQTIWWWFPYRQITGRKIGCVFLGRVWSQGMIDRMVVNLLVFMLLSSDYCSHELMGECVCLFCVNHYRNTAKRVNNHH